jgi:hypothetical protein
MQPSFFAITAAVLLLASSIGSCAATVAAPTVDPTGWRAYRNDQYFIELRYPPDYAVVKPRDQLLRPQHLFRVWFKEASLVNSPPRIGSRLNLPSMSMTMHHSKRWTPGSLAAEWPGISRVRHTSLSTSEG